MLKKIIDTAQEFRNHISMYCNPILSTASEAETQRFYLRKIEGAEILLAYETNFFRQEVHKWSQVAPEAPPVIEDSKSTRKPRPTKLQKLLHQYGVDDPDHLPEPVRGKGTVLARKARAAEAAVAAEAAALAAASRSPGPHGLGAGCHQFYSRPSSSQPQTPGLSVASSSHAHPSRGPDSSSSHGPPQNHLHGRSNSGSTSILRSDTMNLDDDAQASFFMRERPASGPQLLVGANLSLQQQLLRAENDDGKMFSISGDGRSRALEILSRTEDGRRRAEEVFARGAWDGGGATGAGLLSRSQVEDNNRSADHLFISLCSSDDEDRQHEGGGRRGREVEINGNKHVTPEDLENERNGMDALLDGE